MRKPAYNALEIARSVVVAILERSGIDLINCRNLPPLPDHCRFAVERRGHLWKSRARCHRYSGTAVRTESSGKICGPTRKPKKQSATRNPRSSSRLRSGCANCCNPRAWTVGRRPPAARACTSWFRSAATSVTTPRACIATGWRNAWKRQLPLVTRPRPRRRSATSLSISIISATDAARRRSAAYSPRAREGFPVAAPVTWAQV
jgi:hypothetical protein